MLLLPLFCVADAVLVILRGLASTRFAARVCRFVVFGM